MRLWLDDERKMPGGFDLHARTAAEAITVLETRRVSYVSLDHDLGDDAAGTGYEVAAWIERAAAEGRLSRLGWTVHSANPPGRARIMRAMESAERFWASLNP